MGVVRSGLVEERGHVDVAAAEAILVPHAVRHAAGGVGRHAACVLILGDPSPRVQVRALASLGLTPILLPRCYRPVVFDKVSEGLQQCLKHQFVFVNFA